jgi:hypothetical protein
MNAILQNVVAAIFLLNKAQNVVFRSKNRSLLNVDFTSDAPLDDISGLAVTFEPADVEMADNGSSEPSQNKTGSPKKAEWQKNKLDASSKVGQKRRLSPEKVTESTQASQNVDKTTLGNVDAPTAQEANVDEP